MIYPNPRHLRAFAAVADTGSFSAAAQAVHLGQPALSQAIANLEDLVGVRLIERTTRAVRLTPAGEAFLVEARRVLEAYERMMQSGSDWKQLRRGRVELLTVPSMAHRLLPALVREFTAKHGDVSVEVHDHADPALRQRLERGEGDLAILSQGDPAAGSALLPFLRDHFRVILPSSHRLARQDAIDVAELASERLILLRRGALFRSYMDAVISGVELAQPPIEVDQPGTLTGMVEGGLGVSLLPALSCPSPALRSVVSRRLVRPDIFRLMAFALPPEREPMPAVQAFVRSALDYLAKHSDKLPEGCELLPTSAQKIRKFLAARPAAPGSRALRSERSVR
jgi:LysR family carnitine catabolism transcriptional activator